MEPRELFEIGPSLGLSAEERDRIEESGQGEGLLVTTDPRGVGVGSVRLELKYIPDAVSGRTYGPYLYGRWRESGRKRSKYIGKVPR